MKNCYDIEHNYGGYGDSETWQQAFDRELAETAMRYVDRAGDYCQEDPAEKICDAFYSTMSDVIGRFCAMVGMPSEKYGLDGKPKDGEGV